MQSVVKMMRYNKQTVNKFIASINDVVAMLDARGVDRTTREVTRSETLPSLLEQCRKMSAEVRNAEPEPIRTIHHFACTGGTMISKCIASLPNTQVLSEVDPLSTLHMGQPKPQFAPTDLIRLLRYNPRGVDEQELIAVFLGGLSAQYHAVAKRGGRLVLRDHAHSHFCFGDTIPDRPTLRTIIANQFEIKSIVTVRHPLDSYLSLIKNDWVHFIPKSLDEYCRRYHIFLDHYNDCDNYRYEDFVTDPKTVLNTITDALQLPFDESFMDTFPVHRMPGDSGRTGATIATRPRHPVTEELERELSHSNLYKCLCERLGYESVVNVL